MMDKSVRRMIAFVMGILLCILCVNVPGISVLADNDTEAAHDMNSISFVSALGIIPADASKPFDINRIITRADMAEILCNYAGVDIKATEQVPVKDISDVGDKSKAVNAAFAYGLIDIPKDGYFYPDEPVKVGQAASLLLNLMGYRPLASGRGEYPYGDILIASETGLTNYISASWDDVITAGAVAQLCYNALSAGYVSTTGFGSEAQYTRYDDADILTELWGLEKGEGRVTANELTTLVGESSLREGDISIGDKIYHSGTTNASELLGYYVEYYSDKNDNIIYIEKEYNSSFLSIDAEKIEKDTSKSRIVYLDENEKEKYAKISELADFIYNGSAVFGFDAKDLMPESGRIELLDCDGDGVYDVIFVREYTTVIADGINAIDLAVTDKITGQIISLDPEDYDSFSMTLNTLGSVRKADVADLKTDSVMNIEKSADGEILIVTASNTRLKAAVKGTKDGELITLGDDEYELSVSCRRLVADGKLQSPEPGCSGTFYFDSYGQIAYFEISDNTENYGYLSKVGMTKSLQPNISFRMFNENGEWETLTGAGKIRLNGTKTEPEDVYSYFCPDKVYKPQIVKYGLNANGAINSIKTFTDRTSESGYIGYDEDNFTKDAVLSQALYKSTGKYFDKTYGLSAEGTIVFNIPNDAVDKGKVDEDRVRKVTSSFFQNDYRYNLEIYDSDALKRPELIVWTESRASAFERNIFFVSSKTTVLDSNGDAKTRLIGYYKDAPASYLCKDEAVGADVVSGDAIQFVLDKNGEIEAVNRVLTLSARNAGTSDALTAESKGELAADGSAMATSKYAMYVGEVYDIDYEQGDILLSVDSSDRLVQFRPGSMTILKYNYDREEYEIGSLASVTGSKNTSTPSMVFIHDRISDTQDVVILN